MKYYFPVICERAPLKYFFINAHNTLLLCFVH